MFNFFLVKPSFREDVSVMGESCLAVLFLHMRCMIHDASNRWDCMISGKESCIVISWGFPIIYWNSERCAASLQIFPSQGNIFLFLPLSLQKPCLSPARPSCFESLYNYRLSCLWLQLLLNFMWLVRHCLAPAWPHIVFLLLLFNASF